MPYLLSDYLEGKVQCVVNLDLITNAIITSDETRLEKYWQVQTRNNYTADRTKPAC